MWKKTLQHISCDVVLSPSCQGQGRVSHDDSFDVPQLSFILSFYLAPVSTPCTSITLTGDFNRILLIPQLMLVRFHLHLLSVSPTITPLPLCLHEATFPSLHSSLSLPVSFRNKCVSAGQSSLVYRTLVGLRWRHYQHAASSMVLDTALELWLYL